MIIIKLNGGLGNQMFEYAFGRALQLKYQDDLALDIEEFRRTYGHVPRHYSLGAFNIPNSVSLLPIEKSSTLLVFKVLHKLCRKWNPRIAMCFNVFWWREPTYINLNVKNISGKKCYFYGYWQSEKYFAEYKDTIKSELKVKNPISKECLPYSKEIERSNAVCLHIRRGDFVQEGQIVCDVAYYERGIQYMEQNVKDARFFIFSDDENWVKGNVRLSSNSTFVKIDNPDYEVLRLMYMCKHFVISNSSFSWWAQYLSDNPNKIVVAPKIWYPGWPDEDSIYQDSWVVL